MIFNYVTILILIDGFLQSDTLGNNKELFISHNPYFNRWFSAIAGPVRLRSLSKSHNPYFNRWFSAILKDFNLKVDNEKSQSLF